MEHASLSSGRLAKAAGVTVETLRFYERRGLLPPPARTASGHRRYGPEALDLVRLIKRAQGLGFTLPEVAELQRTLADPKATCRDVCAAVQLKLDHVDAEIARLESQRRRLRQLREACPRTRPLRDCPVIEDLERRPIRRREA